MSYTDQEVFESWAEEIVFGLQYEPSKQQENTHHSQQNLKGSKEKTAAWQLMPKEKHLA